MNRWVATDESGIHGYVMLNILMKGPQRTQVRRNEEGDILLILAFALRTAAIEEKKRTK